MQACDSLMGNVGGKHISTAKVFSILILIFLIIQYMLPLWLALHSHHGDRERGRVKDRMREKEGGRDHTVVSGGEKVTMALVMAG